MNLRFWSTTSFSAASLTSEDGDVLMIDEHLLVLLLHPSDAKCVFKCAHVFVLELFDLLLLLLNLTLNLPLRLVFSLAIIKLTDPGDLNIVIIRTLILFSSLLSIPTVLGPLLLQLHILLGKIELYLCDRPVIRLQRLDEIH